MRGKTQTESEKRTNLFHQQMNKVFFRFIVNEFTVLYDKRLVTSHNETISKTLELNLGNENDADSAASFVSL